MLNTRVLDLIDECLDEHDEELGATAILIEEALARVEELEKRVAALELRGVGERPPVARNAAEEPEWREPGWGWRR